MSQLRRILLVEDSLKDIELTLEALDQHKLANEVVVARDGTEAIDYLTSSGKFEGREPGLPVVMLLDIKMPKMNGLDVLRRLKSDDSLKSIPVVVVTSSREEPDLAAAYELGANAYVVKPVDFQQFADAVSQIGAFWAVLNEPPPSKLPVRIP